MRQMILVTGALGQIGSELTVELRKVYGTDQVIASDIKPNPNGNVQTAGPFHILDCLDAGKLAEIVKQYRINTIYHLAAVLSAVAESRPQLAWQVNITGLYNVLEVAREYHCSVFTPSSIGAFGPTTPPDRTPQDTIQRPKTMYGVTKVAGELLCDYYFYRFGLDTRGLRYPGLISYQTLPGGGTTDYAVEIYYEAIKNRKYTCYLKKGTFLDMMYMPDALHAAISLMEADPKRLKHRNAFNVTAMSVDPEAITCAIQKHIPEFRITYQIDPVRQAIADSWPNSLDDSAAREEWGWQPKFTLETMTSDMLAKLTVKLKK
ncbi:MAG: L-threonine 3-dehydrogenase [candidate division KSB1 bacterium]|nr:L-threonine 3-dehydrogenase [candidate division KSB1 bacterium]MDZ7317916.1 L-threonine 3-dehydrogenase [candidate division KSB1 bacterium]MDZ7339876.1 L-threonine 3-dehydrogenase [candidate division KSB1 bacterium]